MSVVQPVAKTRRGYFVQNKPIMAIRRELGLSRKVVRKGLRSKATEFRYSREHQPLPKPAPGAMPFDVSPLRMTDLAEITSRATA